MKKKNILDKINIELDLTSLLDVIFIVLMVVMCHSIVETQNEKEKALEAVTEAEAGKSANMVYDELSASIKLYEARKDDIDNLENKVAFADLYVNVDQNDIKTRYIRFLLKDNLLIEEMEVNPDNEGSVYLEFQSKLEEYLTANADVPVLLTLDESDILYRDHVKMEEILGELSQDYDNLFIQ